MPENKAYAVATSRLQKYGVLRKGSQALTPKGQVRNDMTAGERAIDRAVKASGGKHAKGDYKYTPKTNLATLRSK